MHYPLTPPEIGMYLEHKLNPSSAEYTLDFGLVIKGVGENEINSAMSEIFTRHESLRSYYSEDNGVPVRVISDEVPKIIWKEAPSRGEVENIISANDGAFSLSSIPVRVTGYKIPDGSIILHFSVHHIAFDGTSYNILTKELFSLLKHETLPESQLDITDIARVDRSEEYEHGRKFYREMFADGVPVNDMPVKCARPKIHPQHNSVKSYTFTEQEISSLTKSAHDLGVTVFGLMFSAASIAVGKYCGSEDIVMGLSVNTRPKDYANVIGMFVNRAPVRLKPNAGREVNEYVRDVAGLVKSASRESSLPFSEVVKEFAPDRDESRIPVFDVSVNYRHMPGKIDDGKISIEFIKTLRKIRDDITVTIDRADSGMKLFVQYSSELFDDELIAHFIEQIRETLRLMQENTNAKISDVSVLPEKQREEIQKFSASATSDIPIKLLHRMFEKAASENPGKIAVIASDRNLTFKELNEEANIVAHNLRSRGLKLRDSAVLLLPRRSYYFSALFGVLKAGATFIPCDPEYPKDRISHIITDADSRFIITTSEHKDDYEPEKVLLIDELIAGDRKDNPDVDMSPDDLAYMIYTSGSTGKPKGVMLRHIGICNFCTRNKANILYDFEKSDISAILSVTTVSFDLGLKDTVGMLVNGKTIVFADEEQMNDPVALTELFDSTGADAINATPSRYLQYMEYEPFRKSLAKCRLIVAGGELYPLALLKMLQEQTSARLINTYGPTDTTISANMAELERSERVTVGRPLLNVHEYIVDAGGNPVPVGVIGELLIGGLGVAVGYKGLDEQTRQKFITYHGERVYSSGDYAKWDNSGNVIILGRKDNQVKLRGLRIELSEIERLIEKQPGIKKAVVIIRKISGQENLCAYFTADSKIDIPSLRDELKKSLTHYMIPGAFMQLDKIPMSANGKTDIHALPEPEIVREEILPPSNETQRKICGIVSDVTGQNSFGVNTDLFSAGLTSLNSVKLSLKLSEIFGVNIPIREFRDNNTVQKLESLIASHIGDKETFEAKTEYSLTKTQEGIYTESVFHSGTTIYNIAKLLILPEGTDIERLKDSIIAAIEAHPYIKVRLFTNADGKIMARRNDGEIFSASDIDEISCANIEEVKSTLVRPYDLTSERLFRVKIIHAEREYLFVDFHHIISDGYSMAIFFRDISAAYFSHELTREKFTGYEAAQIEERLRESPRYEEDRKYYAEIFGGCDFGSVPDSDVQDDGIDGSGFLEIESRHADFGRISRFCADTGITENTFFTGAYGYVLAGFSGEDGALFATVHNGRNDPRFSGSMSMFVHTIPVLCGITDASIGDYLSATGEQLHKSMNHDIYSFAEISRELGISAEMIFVYQGAIPDVEFLGEPLKSVSLALEEAKSAIAFEVFPDEGGKLRYVISWRKSQYTEDFIRSFAGVYDKVLSEFTERKELREINFADDYSLSLMDKVNETETDYDKSDIVTQFRRVAEKFPDNIALVYKDKRYTYREVDEITERIAAYLKGRAIGSEDVVSVLIPRCEYMVLASLGVLKSCAAYQPLDPSYPPERLEFMIDDASAKLLIADRNLIKDCVPNYHGEILYTDEIPSLPHAQKLTENPSPSNLFIMLYTSGSTGVPKGVMLEHGNLACFIAWYRKNYSLTEKSRAAAYASYGFDACMMDLYPAITSGAAVHILDEEIRLDFAALQKYFDSEGITHCFMTTQVGRQFAEYYTGQSLKYLSVGGERLSPFFPDNKSFVFLNGYGPTECTIFTTLLPVKKLYRRIPIGVALDNMKLYIIDKNGRKLPPYMPGELWVSGHQVGRGYFNRPDKNAQSFITNPFTSQEGYTKIYRTGDIVRNVYDGGKMVIDFVGRKDSQVKIRGFRIELTEIEAVIRDFPGVEDVTVQAFDNPDGSGKFVAAYVVSDEKIDVKALNEFIGQNKPHYMIPSVTMQIDSIPLNQNQKVNRKALPKPEITATHTESESVSAPLNVLEQNIKAIIAEITGTDSFGITDTLGNFGLTSISSIRLATQIYKKYGVQLQVRKLVSEGSVQSIENEILRKVFAPESNVEKSESTESHEPSKRSCGLTFEQQGVYADCMIDTSSTVYNTPFSVKIPDGITVEQLREAICGVVEAHPYILCRFTANENNEIIQEPIPNFTLDATKISEKEMSAQDYESYRKEGFVRPFNLSEGPLVRFEIVKSDGLYLLMDMHHLVTDGASVDIFLHQLCEKLDCQEIEHEEYSYYDYAADERMTEGADDFFAGRMALSDEATQIIPDVYGDNLKHSEASVSVKTNIKAVKDFALKNGATPAEIYLAAGYITFSRFVCNDTVSIMTISNGRGNMKIHDTLGMFVNSLPLVETVESSENVADFIRRAAKNFNDTLMHENYPFARAASKFDFHPSISYAYQIGVLSEYRTKYGALIAEELVSDKAKIPVAVFITGTEDEAEIKISYDTALYSREIMQSLTECYENAVRGLLTSEKISDISITDSRQWEILDSYNPEWDLNYDMNDTPITAFRRNAKNNPEKVAAVFMDKQYTYRELDELTDKLAAKIYSTMRKITGKEKLAEEVISIIIPRNENVFILPLAVVKSGCAYEPLDPSYPQERLNFMVKDSGAKLLIADDSLRSLVNEYQGDVLTVSELYDMADSNDTPPSPSPDDLFVMLYTSGSTGTPKGCQIEHRNVVALAHGIELAGFYREDDKIADYASFGFDVNMADVFCTLINGGTVYIIPQDIRMNLDLLAKYFDEAGITALLLTTQVGVQFMQNYPDCKTLRLLLIAGEKLPAVDPSGLSYTIANGYGPTENCYGVSIFPIRKWEQNIPVGKPFPTIHGYILDKTGHRLPAGAAGEYCLSGPQVSRGYLNRPDKTAEAYEDCPFNEYRMYHTGDIVRYRQDGNVEFVGRKDGQVKIRGFRIETKEIEAVIRSFDGVKDATVQAYDYESGGKYLAAFVVSDETIDTAKLANYIKSQKPAYMVPAVIMQIDKVPLTVNQKVDKKALPKPELQRREYVAPVGKTEEDFCGIFGEILGLERVSAEDDFFELGGSSVIAMKVVIAAGKKGYSIVYNDVFTYTTPRLLAEFVTGSTAQTEEITATIAPSAGKITEIDSDGYDYSAIHALLAQNTMEAFRSGERQNLGDILLAGATGYLGIHVLEEILTNTESKVFCLIRPKEGSSGEKRLRNLLEYYFCHDHAEYFASRITVIEGDATNPDSLKGFVPDSNMTVINCAASVKHFAKGNEIEHANIDSVKNLVAWCEANNARLVHISTGSIIGGRKNGLPPEGYRFDEHVLFAGQTVSHNQYIHSKFMAERFIYEEILTHGLNAKVFRVGNLAPRLSDGKFQVNFRTNNIMNNLRAYKILGMVSFNALAEEIEFSPIDCLAKAVITLARTPRECICFIPINPHRALMQDVFTEISGLGYEIRTVEDDELKQALDAALSDSNKNSAVSPLVAYSNNSDIHDLGYESLNTGFTSQILYRLGFSWPETGTEYIRQFIRKLNGLSFFDE